MNLGPEFFVRFLNVHWFTFDQNWVSSNFKSFSFLQACLELGRRGSSSHLPGRAGDAHQDQAPGPRHGQLCQQQIKMKNSFFHLFM